MLLFFFAVFATALAQGRDTARRSAEAIHSGQVYRTAHRVEDRAPIYREVGVGPGGRHAIAEEEHQPGAAGARMRRRATARRAACEDEGAEKRHLP